jgi:hypothetical protein
VTDEAVEDAVALWIALFGTPPPIRTDVALLLEIAVSCCPTPLPYTLGVTAHVSDRLEEGPPVA